MKKLLDKILDVAIVSMLLICYAVFLYRMFGNSTEIILKLFTGGIIGVYSIIHLV